MTNNTTMEEDLDTRMKRLSMRSMRRGTKEIDFILSGFCEYHLSEMDEDALNLYEALLSENDQDLYQWITGQMTVREPYEDLLSQIRKYLNKKY